VDGQTTKGTAQGETILPFRNRKGTVTGNNTGLSQYSPLQEQHKGTAQGETILPFRKQKRNSNGNSRVETILPSKGTVTK
jgi:hypothetical protein